MSREDFYKNLPDFPEHPTTAVPSPQKFHAIYEALADEGATEVLSIHISSTLSAAVNVASTAAGETTSVPVTVLDSGSLSMGTGFLVQTAAELAKQGLAVKEILPRLEDQINRTHVWALLDTLKYLRRSGRMNQFVSVIGDIMHIKPILKMQDGASSVEKVRTQKNGLNRLITMLKEFSPFEKIAFLHSNALEEVKTLQTMVSDLIPNQETWFEIINPVLGAHLGTGVVGFSCVTKK
jgi:DegV family protein with EDD domain